MPSKNQNSHREQQRHSTPEDNGWQPGRKEGMAWQGGTNDRISPSLLSVGSRGRKGLRRRRRRRRRPRLLFRAFNHTLIGELGWMARWRAADSLTRRPAARPTGLWARPRWSLEHFFQSNACQAVPPSVGEKSRVPFGYMTSLAKLVTETIPVKYFSLR